MNIGSTPHPGLQSPQGLFHFWVVEWIPLNLYLQLLLLLHTGMSMEVSN